MNALVPQVPYHDMEKMAIAIAKSGLFGMKSPEQALALMCVAQAEGRHPGSVATEYHIIQGRPALKADTMLARFQAAGGKVQWTEYTDKRVAAIFSHPNGGSIEIDWTFERAKAAGLTGKDNWRNYQRQMLRARVVSEGVRTVYPGVVLGIYTPEEVEAFEPADTLRAADAEVTTETAAGAEDRPPVKQPERKPGSTGKATANQVRLLHARIDASGVGESQFLKHFELESVSDLPFAKVDTALEWLSQVV